MVKQKIKIMITALSFCFGMCYANGVSEQVDLKSLLRQTVEENTVFPVLLALNAESTADASEATIETIMLKKLIQIEQKLKNVAIKNDDKSTSDSADEIDVKALKNMMINDTDTLYLMHLNHQGQRNARKAAVAALMLEKLTQIEKKVNQEAK